MSDNNERQQQILDAAAAVIIRLGYDKTTMSDIAEEAGASRRTVYLYFKGKEELFEALLYREYMQYAQTWLEQIEADPRGGTVGGFYRALFHSVNSRPLIAAMMRRDTARGRQLPSQARQPLRPNVFRGEHARFLSGAASGGGDSPGYRCGRDLTHRRNAVVWPVDHRGFQTA